MSKRVADAGDVGGHLDDGAWDLIRPTAGCLTRLDLSGNGLGPCLPPALSERCPALKELIVSNNTLEALWSHPTTHLKAGPPLLRSLTAVDASGNRLTAPSVDAALGALVGDRGNDCRVRTPPRSGLVRAQGLGGTGGGGGRMDGGSGGGGVALRHLNLQRNALAAVPISVFDCLALQSLLLGSNKLKVLERSEGRSTWSRFDLLGVLDLSSNHISELGDLPSEAARGMFNLRNLDLSNNDLREIPPLFGLLTGLNALAIHGVLQSVSAHLVRK